MAYERHRKRCRAARPLLVGVASERLGSRGHSPDIGDPFSDFGEAWAAFVAREELESFYANLPEDEDATLDVWLIEPPEAVKRAAAELQSAFAHLRWIVPTPFHFLHVMIAHDTGVEPPVVAPFEVRYRRVNCFDDAVIVEAEGDGLWQLARGLREVAFFLPHVSIGYVHRPGAQGQLRDALTPLREIELGMQQVDEVLRCRVPVSRTTILQPWRVLKRVRLRR
jgi:2'-5' RNA ligase